MAAPAAAHGAPITHRRQLTAWLEDGCKPAADWRIGTEHEKFAFRLKDLRPLPYEGPDGIGAVLEGLRTRFGWSPIFEGETLIGLSDQGCNITLEPGGQVELSGRPVQSLHETCQEVNEHLRQVRQVGDQLGIGMIGLGFQPKWRFAETPWMPKARYRIMRDYMPKRGTLGLDMMARTCTVQVNLDFSDEADMVQKMRVGLALQPLATAIFASSPFTDGQPNGFQSYRSHIWTDTDPDRCGDLPFVFEDGFGFERYVDYALDVPMYFVYRNQGYIDASGQSFRDFLDGRLPALPGETPLITDWADHLTTLFPEVRLKRFLEMRGADGGPWRRLCALPALWVGLLYDRVALDQASQLIKDWSAEERAALRRDVPRSGLETSFRNRCVRDLARDMLTIAQGGLRRRAAVDGTREDETHYLDTLFAITGSGRTLATELLDHYHSDWNRSVDPAFEAYAY